MIRPAIVAVVALVFGATTVLSFQQLPEVNAGLDAQPEGNTATSLGTIDSCVSVAQGDEFQVDLFVQDVPPADAGFAGLGGIAYNLRFDPAVVNVSAVDNNQVLTAEGEPTLIENIDADWVASEATSIDFDPLPSTGGNLYVSVGIISPEQIFPDGDGVVSRLTLTAVGAGTTVLSMADGQRPGPKVLDATGDVYPLGTVAYAEVVVGGDCGPPLTPVTPDEQPLPGGETFAPTPSPAPSVTGRASPTGGGTSPGASPGTDGDTAVAIDASTAGNEAKVLDSIDECAAADVGDIFFVDLVVTDVTDLLAWEAGINYDPAVLNVTDRDVRLFQASNTGAEIVDTSSQTPDDSGRYVASAIDTADPPAPDSGSGVLARLTFSAIAAGTSSVDLEPVDLNDNQEPDRGVTLKNQENEAIGDEDGDSIFDGPTTGAEIRVGSACPDSDTRVVLTSQVSATAGPAGNGDDDDGGSDTGLIVSIIAAVLVLAGVLGGAAYIYRRRAAGP